MFIHAIALAATAQQSSFDILFDNSDVMVLQAHGLRTTSESKVITFMGPARIQLKGADTSVDLSRRGSYILVVVKSKDGKGNDTAGGSFEIPVGNTPIKITYDQEAKAYRFEH